MTNEVLPQLSSLSSEEMEHRSHRSEECDSNRFLSEFTYHGSSITAKCSGGRVNKKSGSTFVLSIESCVCAMEAEYQRVIPFGND